MSNTDTTPKTPLQDILGENGIRLEYKTGDYPAAGKTITIGGVPHVFVPHNNDLTNMEASLAAPARIRARPVVRQLSSFLAYVSQFKQTPGTRIFVNNDQSGLTATAIFDYPPDAATPAWGGHRITFLTEHTPEWLRWRFMDKKAMLQMTFAEFVEDNQIFFLQPSGADMLTLARDIELTQSVEWKGSVRTDTGDTALAYENTTKAGKGTIELPKSFTIRIKPFRGEDAHEIEARLRPRLVDQKLQVHYELLRVEEFLQEAMDEIVKSITSGTGIVPMVGNAPDVL